MTCKKHEAIDIGDFLKNREAERWAEFRHHVESCRSCRRSVANFIIDHASAAPTQTDEARNHHPTARTFVRFERGMLSDDETSSIAAHLEGCASCRQEQRMFRSGMERRRALLEDSPDGLEYESDPSYPETSVVRDEVPTSIGSRLRDLSVPFPLAAAAALAFMAIVPVSTLQLAGMTSGDGKTLLPARGGDGPDIRQANVSTDTKTCVVYFTGQNTGVELSTDLGSGGQDVCVFEVSDLGGLERFVMHLTFGNRVDHKRLVDLRLGDSPLILLGGLNSGTYELRILDSETYEPIENLHWTVKLNRI